MKYLQKEKWENYYILMKFQFDSLDEGWWMTDGCYSFISVHIEVFSDIK